MSDSTINLEQIDSAQAAKEVTANQLFDAASPATIYGRHAEACAGLTFGYYGGRYGGVAVANGAQLLAASTVTYMVVARATAVVSFATTTTNWNDATNYARAYKLTTGPATVTAYEDHRAGPNGTQGGGASTAPGASAKVLQVAASDETTALTAGTAKVTFRMPYAITLTGVRASLTFPQPSGSLFTVDIKQGGVSIFSTKLTIDNAERTSVTAVTSAVLSTTALTDDAEITVDVFQVGASGAAGLKIALVGT